MGFGTELQSQHSHQCLVKLQDTEIRLLEIIKKCVTHRIKCDRDYAQSLNQLLVIAGKFDNPDGYTSPVFKAWSTIVSETEKISQQIKANADRMCTSTMEKLVELVNEKKVARKAYIDERNRLDSDFNKLQERLKKCHNDYQKCHTKLMTEKCKYDDSVAKGKSGKKMGDQKAKYEKCLGSLHQAHNEYVTDIHDVVAHQKDFLHTTLPGLLDYQQGLLESMTQQCKEILQEYTSLTDSSAEEFSKCHTEVMKTVSAIHPSGEHDDFLNNSRGDPLESQRFDFDSSVLDENSVNLQADLISLNNVTKSTLEQKAETFATEANVLKERINSKKTELQQCEQEMGSLPPLNNMDESDKISHYSLKKQAQILRRDIAELTCKRERFESLHKLVNDPISQLTGDPPLIIDLTADGSLSRTSSQNKTAAPQAPSSANVSANSSSSLGGSLEAHALVAKDKFNSFKKSLSDKFKRQQQSSDPPEPPSKDFLDTSSQENNSPTPPEPKAKEKSMIGGGTSNVKGKEGGVGGGGGIVSELTKKLQQQGVSTSVPDPEDRKALRQNTGKYEKCEVSNDKPSITSSNIVSRPIQEEDWFHGVLPREEVVRLLQNNGDYLVRESKSKKTGQVQYVLSVMWNEHKHFIIQGQENEWRFEGSSFGSIQELIREQHSSGAPVTKKSQAILRKAILREEWELSNDDIVLGIKLGNGNFGDVFKGVFKGQEVAVKTCRETLSEEQKKKFLQEGRILKQYNHPNIVKFIGIGAQRQPVMIVMEYVSGGALLNFLRSEGKKVPKKLNCKQMLKMCTDAAAGMAYLEERSCIHRDLAARNCLVGSDNVVKISDFGMSREEEEYTVSGGLKQIPIKWTAPEALNFGTYTTACDVWSFGILMWEVFSFGATPYQGLTNNQAREKVDAGYRMPAPDGMPNDIEKVMDSCWEATPSDRPKFEDLHKRLLSIKKTI